MSKKLGSYQYTEGSLKKINATIDLAQTTLDIAKRFELTEIIVNTSRVLTQSYHVHHPLSKKANDYEKLYRKSRRLLEAEYLAEELYDDLSKNFIKIKATQKHLQARADECLEQLLPFVEEYDSFRLHLCTRLIEIIKYMCVNDYGNALKVADKSIDFFESKPFETKAQLAVFLHQKTVCCTQIKLFEEGRKTAIRSRQLVDEGTYNWFRDGLTFIFLCFHTQHYQEAWDIYVDMINNKAFKTLNKVIKEEILIAESYLQYLISLHKIKVQREAKKYVEAFNTSQFVNEMPTFGKDKRGSNITILIAQILWLLKEKNHIAVKARVEALDKYRTRHLDASEDTYRTNLFIKMVNTLEKCHYRKVRVVTKTKELLSELKSAPIQVVYQAYSTEILPYDDIWALIVETL
jgi:hypothetical protein